MAPFSRPEVGRSVHQVKIILLAFRAFLLAILALGDAVARAQDAAGLSNCPARSQPSPEIGSSGSITRAFWTNSIGIVFVLVPSTRVKFAVWETRVGDFSA